MSVAAKAMGKEPRPCGDDRVAAIAMGFRVPESPESEIIKSEIIKSIFGVLYLAARKPR